MNQLNEKYKIVVQQAKHHVISYQKLLKLLFKIKFKHTEIAF